MTEEEKQMPDGVSLVVVKGPDEGKSYSFTQEIITIGRTDSGNDLSLSDPSVSSRHARISFEEDKYFLEDLGSTNKTFLGGRQLDVGTKVHLKDGDELSLGTVVLRFAVLEEDDAATRVISLGPQKDIFQQVSKKLGVDQTFMKKNKRLVMMAAAVVGLLLLLSLIKMCGQGDGPADQTAAPAAPDKSLEPMPLPAPDVYGNCRPDRTHPDKAIFTFVAQSAGIDLYYTVGGIEAEGEVVVLLNDKKVADTPLAMKGWSDEQTVRLPRRLIVEGSENRIVFDNTLNPPGKSEWGVKNVRIELLPTGTCDEAEGRRFLELGDEMYEEKAVSEGNTYRAWEFYSKAIAQVEGCRPEPYMLAEMERKMRLANEEIETRYNNLLFSYKKAVKLSNYDEAKVNLERIVQLIPDQKDDRHKEAVRLLKKITNYLRARGR